MSDTAIGLEQTEVEMLTYEVTDEALEAAAGTERQHNTMYNTMNFCCAVSPQLFTAAAVAT